MLSDACRRWHELGATYDAAVVCGRLAEAYRAIGDEASAAQETALAEAIFERLGSHRPAPEAPDGLSTRECEVLALVAEGRSNRQIGADLFISDRTVARHLTNIFHKIDVESRTQAAPVRPRSPHGVGQVARPEGHAYAQPRSACLPDWSIAPTRRTRRASQHGHQARRTAAPPLWRAP